MTVWVSELQLLRVTPESISITSSKLTESPTFRMLWAAKPSFHSSTVSYKSYMYNVADAPTSKSKIYMCNNCMQFNTCTIKTHTQT